MSLYLCNVHVQACSFIHTYMTLMNHVRAYMDTLLYVLTTTGHTFSALLQTACLFPQEIKHDDLGQQFYILKFPRLMAQ